MELQNDLIKRAQNTLSEQLKRLDRVITKDWISLEFNSLDFRTDENIKELCETISKHSTPVIYRIYVNSVTDQKTLVSNYLSFHESNRKKQRGVDRFNISKFNGGDSLTLYVGSSAKFKSRLESHLGKGSIRTFALKINKWDNALDYKLKINVFKVEYLDGSPVPQNVLELIEQEVWDIHRPVFGKKSGK